MSGVSAKSSKLRLVAITAGALLVTSGAAAFAAAKVEPTAGVLKVRLGGDAAQTRLVVELDHAVTGKMVDADASGKAVTVSLAHAAVPGDMQGSGAGLIKSWKVEGALGAAEVKLDLVRPAVVKRRFLLPPGDGVTVYRYVIDLTEDLSAPATPTTAAGSAPASSVAAAEPQALPLPPSRSLFKASTPKSKAPILPVTPTKKVIVIDAGHGGHDPGASGSDSREKDLTLAAAKALRDRLEKSGRYKVVMTRDTDVFIPLEKRVQIARRANADLFISLHADSGEDSNIRGATAYTLSEKGAERAARKSTDGDGFLNVSLPGADASVNRILLDLTQRGTVNRSAAFAEGLLERISDVTPLLRRSHRDAGFMVLLAPDVPAVLLEMGFITNRDDEKTLSDSGRRKDLMGAVGDAIDDYFGQEARYALR
jgi:N-acetylmuramoyl-L-alanine amidase